MGAAFITGCVSELEEATAPPEQPAPAPEAAPPSPTEASPTEQQTYALSISVSPQGAGSVFPSSGQYTPDLQVTLTATAASGYTFDYWGGDASGSSPTTTIITDSDKSVIAHFSMVDIAPKPPPTPEPTSPEEPEPTTEYLLELQRSHWGRGIGSISIGDTTISERAFLYIEGSAKNIGSETLTSVICVMKCWSGDTLVKSEEYVVGITIEEVDFVHYYHIPPGQSFDFDIDTADDSAIDNVAIEFKDSLGNIIPHIMK